MFHAERAETLNPHSEFVMEPCCSCGAFRTRRQISQVPSWRPVKEKIIEQDIKNKDPDENLKTYPVFSLYLMKK